MVGPELINELRQIVHEDYGLALTASEADDLGNSLVEYFSLLGAEQHTLLKNKHEDYAQKPTNR